MTDDLSGGRAGRVVQGISIVVALSLCGLAVQATWNMAGELSSMRLDTVNRFAAFEKAQVERGASQALALQELKFKVDEQGRQIADIKESLQKSQPRER